MKIIQRSQIGISRDENSNRLYIIEPMKRDVKKLFKFRYSRYDCIDISKL